MTPGSPSEIVIEPAVVAAVSARAALATPGVVRLEPGIRGLVSTLVRVGRQRWAGADPVPAEGVVVRRDEDGALHVGMNVVLSGDRQVAAVGYAVQREVTRVVSEQTGVVVADVSVSVLDIEPDSA
ncbi:Asp23/Gls24 family envelope stress response protein [Nocardia sp. NPDC005366]|uniref:Asp23/Gls24 family envelope stress response protein n=1 Tax=Nocardia sp. NPDC005366 TaxID=3156878 RepID=UPI0033A8DA79